MDERELILKVRSGDRDAFGELVKLNQKRIFSAIYRLLRNYEDAVEITQDAFIRAYQAIKGFRLRSQFSTWLYRIALNLSYRRLRSREYKIKLKTKSLEESHLQIPFFSTPYQEILTKEQRELIYHGLVTLPQKFYSVIVLHDLEGLSYKEIAKIQGCSLGTVMSRIHRARLKLAKRLKKLE